MNDVPGHSSEAVGDPIAQGPAGRGLTRRVLLAGGVGLGALALMGFSDEEIVTRNVRIIARAEVAGKTVEATAVMGLRWRSTRRGRMYIESNAEAVILDLDGRGTVYVLDAVISDDGRSNVSYWPYLVLGTFGIPGNGHRKDLPTLRALHGRHAVEPLSSQQKKLPVMVSFTDETRRETMFEVKPEDFPDVFGPDVRFVGLWFEFTDDAPTDHIVERLPLMMGQPNPSYRETFPLRDENGRMIPDAERAFPRKLGKTAFIKRSY